MNTRITKQTTVTPITKSTGKSTGSGVANMGNGKGKSIKMGPKINLEETRAKSGTSTKASSLSGWESNKVIELKKMLKDVNKGPGVPSFTSGVINSSAKKKNEKPKAKMLPEVKVTPKKPLLQFGMKRTAKKIK